MEAFSWHAAESAVSTGELPDALRRVHSTTALRRFRPVAPASVFISDNWHLQSEKIRGKVVDQRGPYLISGNWWDEKSWERAEWDLQLGNESLVRAHKSEGTWKIDGVYD
jgi:hypothetical protein